MLEFDDLTPFADNLDEAKAEAMIADAIALARRVAPCIDGEDFPYPDAVKAVLRGAVLRWLDQGSGSQAALTAGPFSVSPQTQVRRSLFFPSEIRELQAMCGRGKAFMIDTTPVCEDE